MRRRPSRCGSAQKVTLFAWDLSGGRPIPENLPPAIYEQIVALEKRFAVHLAVHVLDPATLGYGLADSPVGMLAWILERWTNWSDNGGDVESVFTKDDLLTHATIYRGGNAIDTSIRTYANNKPLPVDAVAQPVAGDRGTHRHHLRRL